MEIRAQCKHIFCPYTHPQLVVGLKGKKTDFECSHVAYQIKVGSVKINLESKVLTIHTSLTSGSG